MFIILVFILTKIKNISLKVCYQESKKKTSLNEKYVHIASHE